MRCLLALALLASSARAETLQLQAQQDGHFTAQAKGACAAPFILTAPAGQRFVIDEVRVEGSPDARLLLEADGQFLALPLRSAVRLDAHFSGALQLSVRLKQPAPSCELTVLGHVAG